MIEKTETESLGFKNAVIVFCRYPSEGRVKKRLAESTGETFAVRFYRLTAERIIGECRKTVDDKTKCFICYSDFKDEFKIKEWLGSGLEYFPQEGNDIGERMINSFKQVFGKGFDKAVLIGTDIPDITAAVLNQAFISLNNSDFVAGPAKDGGFYLLGLKSIDERLFKNINWSGPGVFESLAGNINRIGKTMQLADELADIDTINDLENWLNAEAGAYDLKNIIREILTKR